MYLDVLHVDLDQANAVRLRYELHPGDAAELRQRGHDTQLVIDHLTHPVLRPHQQAHRRLSVLQLCRWRESSVYDINPGHPEEGGLYFEAASTQGSLILSQFIRATVTSGLYG